MRVSNSAGIFPKRGIFQKVHFMKVSIDFVLPQDLAFESQTFKSRGWE
jgi:hypothetical protein